MDKICTSQEQSQKLIELGIDVNSADMHYVRKTTDFMGKPIDGKWSEPKYGNTNSKYSHYIVQNFSSYETLPAWSLTALLWLMPYRTEASKIEPYGKIMKRDTWDGEFCFICYPKGLEKNKHFSGYHNNPVDAAFEMICWLLNK